MKAPATEGRTLLLSERTPCPEVRDEDFKRFLRLPPARTFEGPLAENASWARDWFGKTAQPWIAARSVELTVRPDGIAVDGERFGGPALAARFPADGSAAVVAVSAGPEADAEAARRWAADEPDRYYFLECYAAAAAEALLADACARVGAAFGAPADALKSHGPGYLDWPLADAARLIALLHGTDELPGPLSALASGMLVPKKSRLALVAARGPRSP